MDLLAQDEFEEAMAVFTFSHHQLVQTYIRALKERGFTLQDAAGFVEAKKAEQQANRPFVYQRPCPKCPAVLSGLPVNDSPATRTGDSSKSVWLCMRCNYEEFSELTLQEWQDKLETS